MPPPMVERILAEAGRGGVARQVHFHVMGEPLLYPDLAGAVRAARRHGMEAWVTTNGSLLTTDLLAALREAGLSHLTVSLQTPDAATFTVRGSRQLAFEEYRARLVAAARAHLASPGSLRMTVCFLTNPLRRFHAPNPPTVRMTESARALRAHLASWAEQIVRETPHRTDLDRIVARTRRAGILREARIPLTPRLDFQVRILGNWAGHFDGSVSGARFGYCPGVAENFGILWNGDYVVCCTDFDGRTVLANAGEVPILDYLALPEVQAIATGFRRYRVVHPHCRQCLGDRNPAAALCRQVGSIIYFKLYRKLMAAGARQGAV